MVLIFDEVITGFRLDLGGAQSYFGVTPDLAIFGKAMANGFPIACLAGKRELMEGVARLQVNHSGTYNSNVMATAAACATISELERISYQRLHELGEELMTGLRDLAASMGVPALAQGIGPVFHWRSLSATASSITVAVWRSIKRATATLSVRCWTVAFACCRADCGICRRRIPTRMLNLR